MIALMQIKGESGSKIAGHESDYELTQAAAAGNRKARRQIVDRLFNRVRATATYIAAGHADAEDYAQMSFIEILQSAGSFRGDSSLESWAERITVRTVMRQVKKQRWRGQYVILDPIPEGRQESMAEGAVANRLVSKRIAEFLNVLKPEKRVAVTLQLVYGYSIAEIAEMTDTSVYTVRYQLSTGRKKLRRLISKDPYLKDMLEDE